MGYTMKSSGLPFKELGSSPAKQTKKPVGPVAEEKEISAKEHNVKARMHNVMEYKDRETSPPTRRPKTLKSQISEPFEAVEWNPEPIKKEIFSGKRTTIN